MAAAAAAVASETPQNNLPPVEKVSKSLWGLISTFVGPHTCMASVNRICRDAMKLKVSGPGQAEEFNAKLTKLDQPVKLLVTTKKLKAYSVDHWRLFYLSINGTENQRAKAMATLEIDEEAFNAMSLFANELKESYCVDTFQDSNFFISERFVITKTNSNLDFRNDVFKVYSKHTELLVDQFEYSLSHSIAIPPVQESDCILLYSPWEANLVYKKIGGPLQKSPLFSEGVRKSLFEKGMTDEPHFISYNIKETAHSDHFVIFRLEPKNESVKPQISVVVAMDRRNPDQPSRLIHVEKSNRISQIAIQDRYCCIGKIDKVLAFG